MTDDEQIATMTKPPVVSAGEWQKAWTEMLVQEKEHTRSRDALAAALVHRSAAGRPARILA